MTCRSPTGGVLCGFFRDIKMADTSGVFQASSDVGPGFDGNIFTITYLI